jgi:hypothetical protein
MRNLRHTDSAMEWPAHQLLRQQCDPGMESCSDSDEACSIGGVVHLRKCHSESSGYSNSSGNLKKLATEEQYPPTGHKQQQQQRPELHKVHRSSHAQRAHSWKRRCMSYSRLDGWWVLCAEFLGTIILIALCVVAANQVSSRGSHMGLSLPWNRHSWELKISAVTSGACGSRAVTGSTSLQLQFCPCWAVTCCRCLCCALTAATAAAMTLLCALSAAVCQARSMSEEVDTVALAALARSNSRAICVSAPKSSSREHLCAVGQGLLRDQAKAQACCCCQLLPCAPARYALTACAGCVCFFLRLLLCLPATPGQRVHRQRPGPHHPGGEPTAGAVLFSRRQWPPLEACWAGGRPEGPDWAVELPCQQPRDPHGFCLHTDHASVDV